MWDALKWDSESTNYSTGVNQFKDTFDRVSFWNDYQHTGTKLTYYQHDAAPAGTYGDIPLARRDRTWSMQMPRNIVDINVSSNPDITDTSNWDNSQTYKERMRSKYLMAKLEYNYADASNIETYLSIPFVSAIYRRSIR